MTFVTKAEYKINTVNRTQPEWKDQVERWYQMDAMCFAVSQAAYEFTKQHPVKFDNLILGAVGGSNLADFDFVKFGSSSPSKFVYTLPNIALSTLCQSLKWSGPAQCVICPENEQDVVVRESLDVAKYQNSSVLLFLVDQLVQDHHLRVQVQHAGKVK